mgnify:CR=1 FL=1
MKNFLLRLSSRKFLLTVAGLVGVTLYPEHSDNIVFLIAIFVGGEGVKDTISAYSAQKYVEPAKAEGALALEFDRSNSLNDIEKTIQPGFKPV